MERMKDVKITFYNRVKGGLYVAKITRKGGYKYWWVSAPNGRRVLAMRSEYRTYKVWNKSGDDFNVFSYCENDMNFDLFKEMVRNHEQYMTDNAEGRYYEYMNKFMIGEA